VLAAVLDQLAGAEAEAKGTEATAGVDRGQLPVIANQHHLGLGLLDVLAAQGVTRWWWRPPANTGSRSGPCSRRQASVPFNGSTPLSVVRGAFYRSVGFIPARELPNLWPNHSALLLERVSDLRPVPAARLAHGHDPWP
jgi:hypothetical protein